MQELDELRFSRAMSSLRPLSPLVALAAFGVACGQSAPRDEPHDPPGVAMSVISRSASKGPPTRSVPSVATDDAAAARKEILAHVPKETPASSAKSLLGTDTEEPPADAGEAQAPKASAHVESHVSLVTRPARSAPALEKLLRATVYFDLVNRCKDAKGALLPPEAVLLGFELDASGKIVEGTITAKAKAPEHEGAAECMIRELAASSFRAPPATRGESTTVSMPVPSVD